MDAFVAARQCATRVALKTTKQAPLMSDVIAAFEFLLSPAPIEYGVLLFEGNGTFLEDLLDVCSTAFALSNDSSFDMLDCSMQMQFSHFRILPCA